MAFPRGQQFVFEADISDFFGTIDHDRLLLMVDERVSDRRVLKLLRCGCGRGCWSRGCVSETVTGTPQGGVISPLLANVYLHAFDRAWDESRHRGTGPLRGRLCATNATGGCDVEDRADGGGAALVMEVGPPQPPCRGRSQTTASCCGE